MKSLIFIQSTEISYSISGSSRILNITNELRKLGIDSLIIGRYPHNRSLDTTSDSNLLMVKPILPQNNIIGRILLILQIQMVAIKQAIMTSSQHIYFRGYDMLFIALFAKISGKHLIREFHGYRHVEQIEEGKKYPRVIITKILDNLALKLADHIVALSPGMQAQLPPKYFNRSIVLQNSVNFTEFIEEFTKEEITNLREKYDISPDKKAVGLVTSGGKDVHIDDLIELEEYIDNVYSVVICDLKRTPHLIEKAKHYSNVILTDLMPHREVVILFKHIIDISILPYNKDFYGSRVKNFFSSLKSIEYIAAGKPIIISDVEGIPSFLHEGVNYITYESKNPRQLAEKIKFLLEDRDLCRRLCENNLRLVNEITWEENIRRSGLLEIISGKR